VSERSGLVVALDGPAGAGKSTAGRALARELGYTYVDTCAMYRAVGLVARERGVSPEDDYALADLVAQLRITFVPAPDGQRVLVNGRDVTSEIRSAAIGQWASRVSARPVLRAKLVAMQRELGARGAVVMDGRDIGTVVFPSADVKVYLDAALPERARRRHRELRDAGEAVSYEDVLKEMEQRDERDSTRAAAPLRPAKDAVVIDTTELSPAEVCNRLVALVRERVRS